MIQIVKKPEILRTSPLGCDKSFILNLIEVKSDYLEYACEELKNDFEIGWNAVSIDGTLIRLLGDELQRNHEIALQAIMEKEFVLDFIHFSLRKDREFLLKALEIHASALIIADPILKNDYNFSFDAISINSDAFKYVEGFLRYHEQFKKDADMLIAAINDQTTRLEDIFLSGGNLQVLIDRINIFSQSTESFIYKLSQEHQKEYCFNRLKSNYNYEVFGNLKNALANIPDTIACFNK